MFSLTPHSPSGVVQLMPPQAGLRKLEPVTHLVGPHHSFLVLGSDLGFLHQSAGACGLAFACLLGLVIWPHSPPHTLAFC